MCVDENHMIPVIPTVIYRCRHHRRRRRPPAYVPPYMEYRATHTPAPASTLLYTQKKTAQQNIYISLSHTFVSGEACVHADTHTHTHTPSIPRRETYILSHYYIVRLLKNEEESTPAGVL